MVTSAGTTHWGTLSLGELIRLLEQRPADQDVRWDFSWHSLGVLDSYRGFYNHLALGHVGDTRTVGELLKALKAAVGMTYTGWKGGEYVMDEDTPIWCADPGDCPSTAIVGIHNATDICVLETRYMDV